MRLTAPTRRIASASRCLFCQSLPIRTISTSQNRRAASGPSDDSKPSSNPVLDEYKRRNPDAAPSTGTRGQQAQAQGVMPQQGDIASSSIFEDERRIEEQRQDAEKVKDGEKKDKSLARDPNNIARVIHPDPGARQKWERKKVIQMIRKGGRLSKEQFLKRTEREHLVKSYNMKTSIKKLGMLARQIAGKTIDDAITQMRFSKKKVAQEVLKQLEVARDEAIVMRGMGLGTTASPHTDKVLDEATAGGVSEVVGNKPKSPIEIQLKDRKRHKVEDPSNIYIDQAWVGRGPYGTLPDYRARGRIYMMRTPWTSLSVVLKEETTRIREYKEREEKRRRKITEKVWVHLPDRPVQTQRQWYSW